MIRKSLTSCYRCSGAADAVPYLGAGAPLFRNNPDCLKPLVKGVQTIGACPLGRVLFILHPAGADQLVSEVHDLIMLFKAQKPHDHCVGKIKIHRPVPVPQLVPDSGPVVGPHEQMPVGLLDRADECGLQPSVKGQELSQIIHGSLQRVRGHSQRTPSPHRARGTTVLIPGSRAASPQ